MKKTILILFSCVFVFGCNQDEAEKKVEKEVTKTVSKVEKEINKTVTVAHNAGFFSDACMAGDESNLILRIPKETKLLATKEVLTFSGGIVGFPMYFVKFDGKSGWVSSQSIYDAPEIIVDKSKMGKCHKIEFEEG